VPELTRPVLFCALVAVVAVVFLLGGIVRKRYDVTLIAILVLLIAIAVAGAFGFESPAYQPSTIG